jgi:hypothetical protein
MSMTPIRFVFVLFTVLTLTSASTAQVDEKKFEVGAVFTTITLSDFTAFTSPTTPIQDDTVRGLGGRFAYNLNDNFAIDAEGSFFPEAVFWNEGFGQKLQGFVGAKAGVRNKWAGVFAKARPGVMWFGEFPSRGGCSSTSFGSVCGVSHEKDFAMDLGGVVEFYPSERAIIRIDAGDTLLKYPDRTIAVGNGLTTLHSETKSNFQFSIGFSWRF